MLATTRGSLSGTYPFGSSPLVRVVQQDRTAKRVFVLGVYWRAPFMRGGSAQKGAFLVQALAVASERKIFWTGANAGAIVERIKVPAGAGHLEAPHPMYNGPSGRALDRDFLAPLGISRADAWLCDLVPHTCLNPSQLAARDEKYEPRRRALDLPPVDLPEVPKSLADDGRRAAILAEIEEAKPEVLVLLGDKPIQHFLHHYDGRWRRLSDVSGPYGRIHAMVIGGRRYQVLPLAHPRQTSALGKHSPEWLHRHENWKRDDAAALLGARVA